MGIEYSCQTVESEEETVNNIFKDIFKADMRTGVLYENFLKCLIKNTYDSKYSINREAFDSFLYFILEENRYFEIYRDYLFSIIDQYSEMDGIRKIGLIIIEFGIKNDYRNIKKKYYLEHFKRFYLEKNYSNVNDLATNNEHKSNRYSHNALFSEKNVRSDLYKSYDFDNYRDNGAINNNNNNDYNNLYHGKKSIDLIFDKSNLKSPLQSNFDDEYIIEFNNSNFNSNANLNENFLNFFKKNELEVSDSSIKNLINDIIENNTNNLLYCLKNILSRKRIEILSKSWGPNNKRLLIYEIYRNYSSLVEKFCIFPAMNKKKTRANSVNIENSYEFITSPKNSSNPINSKENISKEEKMKNDLYEFLLTKEKLLSNFFDLTENQLSGDSIRNWLYENSKN